MGLHINPTRLRAPSATPELARIRQVSASSFASAVPPTSPLNDDSFTLAEEKTPLITKNLCDMDE